MTRPHLSRSKSPPRALLIFAGAVGLALLGVMALSWRPGGLPEAAEYACTIGGEPAAGCQVTESARGKELRFQLAGEGGERFEGLLVDSGKSCWLVDVVKLLPAGGAPEGRRAGGQLFICKNDEGWRGTWADGSARPPLFAMRRK